MAVGGMPPTPAARAAFPLDLFLAARAVSLRPMASRVVAFCDHSITLAMVGTLCV